MDFLMKNKEIKKKGGERGMRKLGMIGILAVFFCLVGVVSTFALPVFQPCHTYTFKFEDYELWQDVGGTSGEFDAGDTLYGIFQITTITDYTTNTTVWYPVGEELTGEFSFTVTSANYNSATGLYDIVMAGSFDIYYDTTPDYNPTFNSTNPTDGASYGATDGTLWASLGTITWTTSVTSLDPNDPVNPWPVYNPPTSNTPLASVSNALLMLITNNTGVGWVPPTPTAPGPGFTAASTIYYTGVSNGTDWTFYSNDPITGTVVPEPTTLFLLGTGLIGLAGIGRKRMKK